MAQRSQADNEVPSHPNGLILLEISLYLRIVTSQSDAEYCFA